MTRRELGLGLQSDKAPGEYAALARIAEAGGIDVLSVFSDLLYQPPIGALVEMAQATSRVRLGAACWNPYTLHPYEIAGQVAWLDAVSGGRAYVGLARGTWLGAIGVPQPAPVAHLRDAVAVVRALLSGDDRGYAGEAFVLEPGTTLRYPLPERVPPVLLGAWGPRMCALAGEVADELKVGGTANPDLVPVVRQRVGNGDVRLVVGAVSVVDSDGAAARTRARREVAMYLAVVAALDPTVDLPPDLLPRVQALVAEGREDDAGRLVPDDVLDRFAFAGTPDRVATQVQALYDAGVDRVELGTPHGLTAQDGVRLVASHVRPALAL